MQSQYYLPQYEIKKPYDWQGQQDFSIRRTKICGFEKMAIGILIFLALYVVFVFGMFIQSILTR